MADKVPLNPSNKVLFDCFHCPYRTNRKNNLSRHIITMHTTMMSELNCCGIVFHSKWELKHHNRTVHINGYGCNLCDRIFQRKDLRDRHLSVHSGEKKFKCNTCSYGSSHKNNLERHCRVHREYNGYFTDMPDVMTAPTCLKTISGQLPHSFRYYSCQPSSYMWSIEEGLRQSENYKFSPPFVPTQDTHKSSAPARQTHHHLPLLPQEHSAHQRLSNLDSSVLWPSYESLFRLCAPPTVQWPVSPYVHHIFHHNRNPLDPLPRSLSIRSPDSKSSLRQTGAYQYKECTAPGPEGPEFSRSEEGLPWPEVEINLYRELETPEASQKHQNYFTKYAASTVVRPTPFRHRYNPHYLNLTVFRRRASRETPNS